MDKKVLIQDLSDGLASRRGLPKKDADAFVRSVFEIIGDFLQTEKIVKVKGLGTFKLVTVDSRESVDVNTGERIVIKAYTKVNFTPDSVLRDAVNKPFAQFETVVLHEGTDVADMERMDLSESNGAGNVLGVDGDSDETDETALSESEEVLSGREMDMQSGERHGIGEVSIETAAIEEAGAVEIQDDENENADAETAADSKGKHSDVAEEVGSKTEVVSEIVDEESDVPVDDESEDERASSLQQNAENGIKAESVSAVQEEVLPAGKEEGTHNENGANADARHEEKVHVATQRIEVQKVEHQTVENQHIVQMEPGHHGRRRVYLTPWMMFFVVLLVLSLMSVSYYIGYHHLFYGNHAKVVKRLVVVHPASFKKNTVRIPTEQDSLRVDSGSVRQVQVPEGVRTNVAEIQPGSTRELSVEYPQVKNGGYEIVGTREEHRMRSGETLRGLALRYYGSKDFTVYIAVYNKIANPDLVPEGMLLKIPRLRLKRC